MSCPSLMVFLFFPTGKQLKGAIDKANLPDCHVYLSSVCKPDNKIKVQLKSISLLNNFQLEEDGIRVWRAYNIGPGKFFLWDDLCPDFDSFHIPTLDIIADKAIKQSAPRKVISKDVTNTGLFFCSEADCPATFSRHLDLQKHLDLGKHCEPRTVMDKAKLSFAQKVEERFQSIPKLSSDVSEAEAPSVAMGWALKMPSSAARFSTSQREYLNAIFLEGERTGAKQDGAAVSKMMRVAKDKKGIRLFKYTDFLSPLQIQSYFSRLASKQRQGVVITKTPDTSETPEDISAAVAEGTLPAITEAITDSFK